jgi:hypothetical protein
LPPRIRQNTLSIWTEAAKALRYFETGLATGKVAITIENNQPKQRSSKMIDNPEYAARLQIDYPEKLDKLTTFFRIIWIIPIAIILGLISQTGETVTNTLNQTGEIVRTTRQTVGGLASGLLAATALMIIFRQRYPRWWFDFSRELTRFAARVSAYLFLLTDQYPSTVDEQSVHLEIDYPDVKSDLNLWMPLLKWLLAIPHYIYSVLPFYCCCVCGDLCLVRHSSDRPLPEITLRLYSRSRSLESAS